MVQKIRMAAAEVIGRAHESRGEKCQDRAECSRGRTVSVIALSDGAGSASHAALGAETSVTVISKFLRANFHFLLQQNNDDISIHITERTQSSLNRLAKKGGIHIKDLAATLLFAATDGENYLCGQIGDGRIAKFTKELHATLMFQPYKGEFINETVFITNPTADKYLQVEIGSMSEYSGFALMSDGAEESLFNRSTNQFAQGLARIMTWFDAHSERSVQVAIQQNLEEVMRQKTMDDLSLAILKIAESSQ